MGPVGSFKSKPIVVPPKQPQFMFPPSSVVMDSPRGSLIPLIHLLNREEFVFVMYYAPWCSKSQSARAEFMKAATFFKGEVKFAAVNCWWPEGECRKRYKFLMFPVFMAYHTKLDGYRYYGVTRAEHMIKFVEGLLHPLTAVHSRIDAMELLARHDTVILGFFNLSSVDNMGAYRQFYYASMRILEKDPLQPVGFAVVTQPEVAQVFDLSEYKDIVMLRITNTTLVYPYGSNITSFNLLNWAQKHKGLETVKRLSPEGLKSQALATEINRGPAFIMFHVENPLFNTEYGLRVLKDVALRYRGCMINSAFQDVPSVWSSVVAKDFDKHFELTEMCEYFRQSQIAKRALPCCISTLVENMDDAKRVCDICCGEISKCNLQPHHLSFALNQSSFMSLNCRNVILNYSWAEKLSVCCHLRNDSELEGKRHPSNNGWHFEAPAERKTVFYIKTSNSSDSIPRRSTDRYVRQHLENLPRRLCDRLAVEKFQGLKSLLPQDFNMKDETADLEATAQRLTHIGCISNKSLNFYAMDYTNHWMFSDALGIEVSSSLYEPTAVLFDKLWEVGCKEICQMGQIMHEVVSVVYHLRMFVSFILDFEEGRLRRHKQLHSFHPPRCEEQGAVCITELDSNTFLDAVKEEDKDVVLLIYGHWCGFCHTLSHTFLTLAQYFFPSKHISFVRINGATNDLPWEYMTDSYPTVIFFPARREPFDLYIGKRKRKADSVVFPAEKEITLTNLVRFVLRHATYDTRLHLAADVCSSACIQQNLKRSASLLQRLKRKQVRLQKKFHEVSTAEPSDKESSGNYYGRMSLEYLGTRLQEIQQKIEHVKLLIDYLDKHKDSAISKHELAGLFSQKESSSGA